MDITKITLKEVKLMATKETNKLYKKHTESV